MKRTKIIFLRVDNNLTQEGLGYALGFSRIYISSVESGKIEGSTKFWYKLQRVFGIPTEELESYKQLY